MDILWKLKRYFEGNKKRVIQTVSVLLVFAGALAFRSYSISNSTVTIEETEATVEETVTEFYVDISGAVNSPGVYKVDSETRLFDLIELAGGLTDDADIDSINRAATLEDGQKIIIPTISESSESTTTSTSSTSSSSSNKININTADKDTLMELSGVGEVIAQRIIDYRTETLFTSIEDIKNVKGIGDTTYEKIKDYITV